MNMFLAALFIIGYALLASAVGECFCYSLDTVCWMLIQ